MALCLWYLVKSDLLSVRYCTSLHWTSHLLQGTRNTRPCITGHPVDKAGTDARETEERPEPSEPSRIPGKVKEYYSLT